MQQTQYEQMFATENEHWWFVAKRLFATVFLKEIKAPKKLKIIDLGCGTGAMTQMLGEWGEVLGIEQHPQAVAFLKKRGVSHLASSINQISLLDSSFDLVTIFDVLYHKQVKENLVLQESHRLLRENGYLLVTDCALPFFWSIHDEQVMAKKRFKKRELEQLLVKNGFEIVLSSYTYFATFPFFATQRLILKLSHPPKASTVKKINPILNSILLFFAKLDLFLLQCRISLPIGSSIMILARRK